MVITAAEHAKQTGWSETEIQFAVFSYLEAWGRTLILPNFTPHGWHECDLFSITKSLYFHEIEIKISRADFKADFRKRAKHYTLDGDTRYKYSQKWMPRSFCYACPRRMIEIEDVPEYAGLIWVDRVKADWDNHWTGYRVEIVKKPPGLKLSQKMSSEQVFKITNNLWWKFASTWKKLAKAKIAQVVTNA